MNIVFVCTGNTCRSPMAEAILKHKLPETHVQSIGINAGFNRHCNPNTQSVLQQNGIQLDHQTQPVTEEVLAWADLVLTMTVDHIESLLVKYPDFKEKYYTLKEYVIEEKDKVSGELTELYDIYETKRSDIIQADEERLHHPTFIDIKQNYFTEDIQKIQQLGKKLKNYNISDPFGGSIEVYQQTFVELSYYIDLLISKIK